MRCGGDRRDIERRADTSAAGPRGRPVVIVPGMTAGYHGVTRTHEPSREATVPESQPISWRSIVYGTPVTLSLIHI